MRFGTSAASCFVTILALATAACSGSDGGGTTDPPVTGTVSGQVTAAGAGVPGATLTLSQGASSRTAASSGAGAYSFAAVAAGSWTLGITAPAGFALAAGQAASVPVTVTAGQTATANFTLTQTPGTQVVEVELSGASFAPADVTVAVGTTVRWIYRSGGPHTVTPDGHTLWSEATLTTNGQTFEHTFTGTGVFDYYCDPHRGAGMTGVVRVQ